MLMKLYSVSAWLRGFCYVPLRVILLALHFYFTITQRLLYSVSAFQVRRAYQEKSEREYCREEKKKR
jgi:hypothetical protein